VNGGAGVSIVIGALQLFGSRLLLQVRAAASFGDSELLLEPRDCPRQCGVAHVAAGRGLEAEQLQHGGRVLVDQVERIHYRVHLVRWFPFFANIGIRHRAAWCGRAVKVIDIAILVGRVAGTKRDTSGPPPDNAVRPGHGAASPDSLAGRRRLLPCIWASALAGTDMHALLPRFPMQRDICSRLFSSLNNRLTQNCDRELSPLWIGLSFPACRDGSSGKMHW
jgi:hypothetical protein